MLCGLIVPASPGSLWEMENLRVHWDPLNENLHFNWFAGDVQVWEAGAGLLNFGMLKNHPESLWMYQFLGPTPRKKTGWGLRVSISNKLPKDIDTILSF